MLLLLLAACTPLPGAKPPPEVDTGCDQRWYRDTDADGFGDPARGEAGGCEPPEGYVAEAGDCDDLDPELHPGAAERCDNVDQDCDGAFDEDPTDAPTWHADADHDGFGDAGSGLVACEAPGTHVADASDCDDTDPAVFPGAVELCNDADDDCDGTVDDDPIDGPTWYVDTDGDGWGDAESDVASCTPPEGTSGTDGDCDDTDPLVAPDMPERCNGADDDCDRIADAGSVDAPTGYLDADGDGYGDPTIDITLCSLPAGYVLDATDCDDADATVHPGAAERCGGVDEDCDGAVDEDDAAPTAWYADSDGDGFGDAATVAIECLAPTGYLADATDCDDTDAAVSPVGTETCNAVDDNCDGVTDTDAIDRSTWHADADADGYGDPLATTLACELPTAHVADATDCDDTNAAVSPAGTEVCNAVDDNCDGVTDTDAVDQPTWYADTDGDGFGDAAVTTDTCAAPAGFVADATDCDDAAVDVYPGADEWCDGVDHDCDGLTDEDHSLDAGTWYRDADIDGRGDPTNTVTTCVRPYGYTTDDTDCDDTNDAVHTGMLEYCATPYDDDCDGTAQAVGTSDCVSWYADADIDGYGDATSSQCQCVGDAGFPADNADDCDDADPAAWPGAPEVWADGVDQSCDGDGDAADLADEAVLLYGPAGSYTAGFSLGSADFDGDGLSDLVVGAATADTAATNGGEVYVWLGAPTADVSLGDAALAFPGENTGDRAGSSVSGGDIDGDGLSDLAIGAPGVAGNGAAYVLFAPEATDTLSNADVSVESSELNESLGAYVGFVGDLDGDGADELAVAAGHLQTGSMYLFSNPSGALAPSDATVLLEPATTDGTPKSATRAGDLDGDGVDDLVIGAPGYEDAGVMVGAVFLVYGMPADGAIDDIADERLLGVTISEYAGGDVAPAGDIDGDGLGDIAVGAPGPTLHTGRVYIVTDPATEDLALAHTIFTGAYAGGLGSTVAGGHDLDGDGANDLVFGESFHWSAGARGAAHVVLDVPTGTVTLDDADATLQGTASSNAGNAVHLLADADGDGLADILVGAWHDDTSGPDAGGAWFVRGQ